MIGAFIAFSYLFFWVGGFVILLLLGLFVYDKRYKQKPQGQEDRIKNGFLPTSEVFIDPKDGHKYRVYYNPYSGERDYVREA